MLSHYVSIPVFIISLAVGLFFVYILGPETKTVFIYPSPENIDKILFKDKADNCFQLQQQEVECPSDFSLLAKIPIQT
jgi:hypothetical protein